MKSHFWVAVSIYVLVALIKNRLQLDLSLYTFREILSVTLFENTSFNRGVFDIRYKPEEDRLSISN